MNGANNKLAWFCVKHDTVAKLLFCIPCDVAIGLCIGALGVHWAIGAAIAVLVTLFFLLFVSSASLALMRLPIEQFANGEPYPLLNITYELLKYERNKVNRLNININRCAALSSLGKYQQVIEELEKLNIEANVSVPIHAKYIYYNNLADAYFSLKDIENGEIWYKKASQIFEAMKEGKAKTAYRSTYMLLSAEYLNLKGEYSSALELLAGINANGEKMKIGIAYSAAEAYIALGDIERAKKELSFIAACDKDICTVSVARDLLDSLEKDTMAEK